MSDAELKKFRTDLRQVLCYIKYSKDDVALEECIYRDKGFQHMSKKAVDVLNAVTNSNIEYEEKDGEVDVCIAMDNIRKRYMEAGREEGIGIGHKRGLELGRREMVRNMYQSNMSVESISMVTFLSKDEVKRMLEGA